MTCKDCIHFGICKKGFPWADGKGGGWCDDFKDKSRIVELPCKVGDTLYDIYESVANGNTHIRELKVKDIHIRLDLRDKMWLSVCGYFFGFEEFGKTVFLTREEAEESLRKKVQK